MNGPTKPARNLYPRRLETALAWRWRGLREFLQSVAAARCVKRLNALPGRGPLLAETVRAVVSGGAALGKEVNAIEEKRSAWLASREPLPLPGGESEGGEAFDEGVCVSDACAASKHARECAFLYELVRRLQPLSALELGTNVGISGAYQALALRESREGAELITLDCSPRRLKLARELWDGVGLRNIRAVAGRFEDTLAGVLRELGACNYTFIDGHHDRDATLRYFEQIAAVMPGDAVVVFDDINWSKGMQDAWRQIQQNSRVAIALDLVGFGVCSLRRDAGGRAARLGPVRV